MVPTFYEPEKQPLKELEGSPNEGGTCSNVKIILTTCSTDMVTHSQVTCSTDVHSHMTCSTDIRTDTVQVKWKDNCNHFWKT